MSDLLVDPVSRFVEELTPVLGSIAQDVIPGVPREKTPTEVTMEAYNLVAAFIDSDSRHTDAELWSFIAAFAPRMTTMLAYASPNDVRKAGLVDGKRSWLAAPSLLFDILVEVDRQRGTAHSWRYYQLAMELAQAVCATDEVPSETELAALERFRNVMLRAIDRGGLRRPGGSTGAPASDAAAAKPPPPVQEPARPLEELLAELDGLVGLAPVKAEVKLVANLIKVQNLRKERGLPVMESSRHLVFTGNPGTGKTTVARLLAQIYRTLKVVDNGHLVETDRAGLVAGYVGQTALKVTEVFNSALQGVLLIDEAYALARGGDNDFGREAIDTLVKLVEDHRDDIVVIAAGYPNEMHTFVESNPGLRSRFPKTIHFPDYSTDELVEIFESMCKKASYTLTHPARDAITQWLDAQPRDKGFGNGRLARNLFEAAMAHQASRLVTIDNPTNEQLMELLPEDVVPVQPPTSPAGTS
ncbi:MAG TPA: AAA family ATPase [Acidimicrobiales bacterium]|jgi:Cdc6-like AAA superfamily ATPase|nr:AAA family ATPase [Acidimicrobiales bacterium]